MRLSLIINSCAGDPHSRFQQNFFRQSSYRERHRLLTDEVLPRALEEGFDEVLVAGVFEEGAGYRYVPVRPRRRDRADCLLQREAGARHSRGDILVFGHDDHALGTGFGAELRRLAADPSWSILVPRRVHGATGAVLENGASESYMGGHVLAMRRWVWAEVPWTSVDTEFWDVPMSRLWAAAGAEIRWTDDLIHIDVEAAPGER